MERQKNIRNRVLKAPMTQLNFHHDGKKGPVRSLGASNQTTTVRQGGELAKGLKVLDQFKTLDISYTEKEGLGSMI